MRRAVLLAAGCALFVYLLLREGPAQIAGLLLRIGWNFAAVGAIYAAYEIVRAIAFSKCVPPHERVSYRALLRIRISGEAIQVLTFLGPFLAEPSKAWLLRRHGMSIPGAFAATLTEFLIYTLTSAAVAIAGLTYLLRSFALSQEVVVVAWIITSSASAFILIAAVAILRRIYLVGALFRWMGRLPKIGRHLDVNAAYVRQTEDLLLVVLRGRPARMLSIVAIELVAQALLVGELFVLLHSIGEAASALYPFVIEAATKFISLAFFFIPGQVGASEGSYALVFHALGLPATSGFAIALARRLRSLAVAAAGLLLLSVVKERRA